MEILAFEAAGRRGAIPAGDVREIVRMVEVLPVPDAPAGVEGAIVVRGAGVPVVELGRLLGGPPRPADPKDHLILVAHGPGLAALHVERALDLRTIDPAHIEAPPGDRAGGVSWVAGPGEPLLLITGLGDLLGRVL